MFINSEYRETWEMILLDFNRQLPKIKPNYKRPIVRIYFGWKFDVDAITKSILDLLQGLLYENDKQVIEVSSRKIKENKLIVEVWEDETK